VQACCRVWPRRRRSPWKKISEGRPTTSGKKLKPWLPGRRLGPIAIPDVIIVDGIVVGSAGGTEDVATVDGDGGDDH